MTISIFVLKGDLNGENHSGAFLFLSGIYQTVCKLHFCILHCMYMLGHIYILLVVKREWTMLVVQGE